MPAPLPAGADCRCRPAPEAQPEGEDRGGAAPGPVESTAPSRGAGTRTYDSEGLLIGARQTTSSEILRNNTKPYEQAPSVPYREQRHRWESAEGARVAV